MKRSINKKVSKRTKDETAAILCRLSRDDNLEGESYSIANQKLLLERTARELGYTNILTFVDDGVTGTTMNRKGLNEMTAEINKSTISVVLVKDLSRLGRDYVGVGQYLDFLSENNVRFVAVSDNIDTDDGDMEMIMLALKNVLNECYAADISKKVRTVKKMQGNMGIPLSLPPYGYMKNPENPKNWVIDDEAAEVVRRIFDMTLDGKGIAQIARQLESEKIMTPKHYMFNKGIKKGGTTSENPHYWGHSTIYKILGLREYCGDVINFKTYKKSYKSKKQYSNEPENMMIFKDVHEAIIQRDIFENVQQKRLNKRKRPTSSGEKICFRGCCTARNAVRF